MASTPRMIELCERVPHASACQIVAVGLLLSVIGIDVDLPPHCSTIGRGNSWLFATASASLGCSISPDREGKKMARQKVATCFWYDDKAQEAAEFYVSLLPDSRIDSISHAPDGKVLLVDFTLSGTPYQALNGGPHFTLSEAASISVLTEDQADTDQLWAALTADGGAESRCGWLKDRFGLSWQIVPRRAAELLSGPNAAKVFPALMEMHKIDIAALEAAAK